LQIFGPAVMRTIFSMGRRTSLRWVQPVIDLSSEIGLAPAGHPLFEGSHSPRLVLALFSKVFANPQPDWPANVAVTGFPFHHEAVDLAPGLKAFLEAKPEPVVFTLGSSAVGAAGAFYRESLEAVQQLGIRALFLTGSHSHGLPARMPSSTLAWPYAPHGRVFAHAAALVHQGGIGTTAQALRAGRPMLVVPFAHDQFDNGERIRRLGAGEVLYRSRYRTGRVKKLLERLLSRTSYRDAAVRVRVALEDENSRAAAADAIEGALRRGN
jgi:UDP:flavonoid glycosyltransferase YjiC (YdhE family)